MYLVADELPEETLEGLAQAVSGAKARAAAVWQYLRVCGEPPGPLRAQRVVLARRAYGGSLGNGQS
jgi:hypothetical protein